MASVKQEAEDGIERRGDGAVVELGRHLKKMFLLAEGYRNMNNGSFGTIPRAIQTRQRMYQDLAESRPDIFIRYKYGSLLDQSREAVAALVNAPINSTVFVPNATTAVNVVLRGLAGHWAVETREEKTPLDEILHFDTIFIACRKSVEYLVDTSSGRIAAREIDLSYPCTDEAVVEALRTGIQASRKAGRNPRLAIFDVVSSIPALVVPYQALTDLCRAEGVLSLIDGAQGVGMLPIDVSATDPDFFLSNCHKWLNVPRGCAVFYVAERNQHMISSTLPTSYGYEPSSSSSSSSPSMSSVGDGKHNTVPTPSPPTTPSPLKKDDDKSRFVQNFQSCGTMDNAPYLCVKDSIQWRAQVLGGETRIQEYLHNLAQIGGQKVAEILGTEVLLDNKTGSLSGCAMINVALPLILPGADEEWSITFTTNASTTTTTTTTTPAMETGNTNDANTVLVIKDPAEMSVIVTWMLGTLTDKYDTFVPIFPYRKRLWTRLSATVFLGLEDFEETGRVLKEVCLMVGKGEWVSKD